MIPDDPRIIRQDTTDPITWPSERFPGIHEPGTHGQPVFDVNWLLFTENKSFLRTYGWDYLQPLNPCWLTAIINLVPILLLLSGAIPHVVKHKIFTFINSNSATMFLAFHRFLVLELISDSSKTKLIVRKTTCSKIFLVHFQTPVIPVG